ncbi:hypothetical protein ACJVDH_19700 [Pedobacter sp. AW1-32]|uniref:hypothetical protein n=1 Tax=Pedobacter sp. AW1-32 TaxID=3383026 RepID=UPI003FEE993D
MMKKLMSPFAFDNQDSRFEAVDQPASSFSRKQVDSLTVSHKDGHSSTDTFVSIMRRLGILNLLILLAISVSGQRRVKTFQLMEPNFNTKTITGIISEVYSTKRYGKTFWWVRLGNDTIVHIWAKHLDTVTMKPGLVKSFISIKKLDNNWWKKEKSEYKLYQLTPIPPIEHR